MTMQKEPEDAQAWLWDPDGDSFLDRCPQCMYANVECRLIPCLRTERADEQQVIFLPRTPEGFAKGAAMTMDGKLGGIA